MGRNDKTIEPDARLINDPEYPEYHEYPEYPEYQAILIIRRLQAYMQEWDIQLSEIGDIQVSDIDDVHDVINTEIRKIVHYMESKEDIKSDDIDLLEKITDLREKISDILDEIKTAKNSSH